MAIIKKKELRAMGEDEMKEKLQQLRTELMKEMGAVASGTRAENPGRIGETKRTIARILTILHERGVKAE
jgi:large subunit ribosomal protein L29